MATIFDPTHPHYKVHRDFVEGGFAHPDNPPQIECSAPAGPWYLTSNPSWSEGTNYRIKPRMRSRTVTYPDPMRSVPAEDTEVWIVLALFKGPDQIVWGDRASYRQMFNAGMCFTNEADAQACYDALFGEQK